MSTSDYTSKFCPHCKQTKPATNEYFCANKCTPDGLQSWCKECINQHQNGRYANDPEFRERVNQQQRERRANDSEWHEREKQQKKEKQRERRANPEYREREKQRSKVKQHKRRAAEGEFTTADVELQYRSQRGKCWHCGKELNGVYHVDHLIPLDKGGTNYANNIVCSCKKCNLSKGGKYTYEWNGRLF